MPAWQVKSGNCTNFHTVKPQMLLSTLSELVPVGLSPMAVCHVGGKHLSHTACPLEYPKGLCIGPLSYKLQIMEVELIHYLSRYNHQLTWLLRPLCYAVVSFHSVNTDFRMSLISQHQL